MVTPPLLSSWPPLLAPRRPGKAGRSVPGPLPSGAPGSRVGGRRRPEGALPARRGPLAPGASRGPDAYKVTLEAEPLAREGGGTRPSGGWLYVSLNHPGSHL